MGSHFPRMLAFNLPTKLHSNAHIRMLRCANWNNRPRHPRPSCQPSTYVPDAGAITAVAGSAPSPAWIFTGFVKWKQTPLGLNEAPSGPLMVSIMNIGFTLLLLRRASMYGCNSDFGGFHHNSTSSPSEFTLWALIFRFLLTTPFPQMCLICGLTSDNFQTSLLKNILLLSARAYSTCFQELNVLTWPCSTDHKNSRRKF